MAYTNGFPATYPQMYYQPTYQQPMPVIQQPIQQPVTTPTVQPVQAQNTNSIIWVQGEAGAKSHLVAPNTTVPLWDSEAQRIFLKSADAAGMPSMKILNYTIEETPNIGAPAQRAVNGPTMASNANGGILGAEAQKALEGQIQAVRSDLEAIRAEMETFRGDLYGIAGKKATTTAANRKKEVSSDD